MDSLFLSMAEAGMGFSSRSAASSHSLRGSFGIPEPSIVVYTKPWPSVSYMSKKTPERKRKPGSSKEL